MYPLRFCGYMLACMIVDWLVFVRSSCFSDGKTRSIGRSPYARLFRIIPLRQVNLPERMLRNNRAHLQPVTIHYSKNIPSIQSVFYFFIPRIACIRRSVMIPPTTPIRVPAMQPAARRNREIVKYACCLDNDSCECDLTDVVGDAAEDTDTDLGEFSRFL